MSDDAKKLAALANASSRSQSRRLEIQTKAKSWKMQVQTVGDGPDTWTGNGCAFATEEEADAAGEELMDRWFAVTKTRTIESDETVNYRMVDGRPRSLRSLGEDPPCVACGAPESVCECN